MPSVSELGRRFSWEGERERRVNQIYLFLLLSIYVTKNEYFKYIAVPLPLPLNTLHAKSFSSESYYEEKSNYFVQNPLFLFHTLFLSFQIGSVSSTGAYMATTVPDHAGLFTLLFLILWFLHILWNTFFLIFDDKLFPNNWGTSKVEINWYFFNSEMFQKIQKFF